MCAWRTWHLIASLALIVECGTDKTFLSALEKLEYSFGLIALVCLATHQRMPVVPSLA